MIDNDELELLSFSLGDLNLLSEVQPGADGIITNSCTGQLTGNVFFGKAGVGKSTISSLVSSKPDLFEVGSSGQGTTTVGVGIEVLSQMTIQCFNFYEITLTI